MTVMNSARRLGPFEVSPIGLGCMNLSHAYGAPVAPELGRKLLQRARPQRDAGRRRVVGASLPVHAGQKRRCVSEFPASDL